MGITRDFPRELEGRPGGENKHPVGSRGIPFDPPVIPMGMNTRDFPARTRGTYLPGAGTEGISWYPVRPRGVPIRSTGNNSNNRKTRETSRGNL